MNVPEVMTLAQVNIDEGPLQDLTTDTGNAVGNILGVVIGIAALVFASILLMKSLSAFKKNDSNEGIKHLVFGVIVAIIGVISFTGLGNIAETINPVDTGGQQDNPFMQ